MEEAAKVEAVQKELDPLTPLLGGETNEELRARVEALQKMRSGQIIQRRQEGKRKVRTPGDSTAKAVDF